MTAAQQSDSRNLAQVQAEVDRVSEAYFRLVLVVGSAGAGKTRILRELAARTGVSVTNVSLVLAEQLLDLPRSRRPLDAERLLAEALPRAADKPLVLDNLEILFEPSLHLDPLLAVQRLARSRTVVASWAGSWENALCYAEPNHPEWRRYSDVDAGIVVL